jgi:hypothetical protein
MASTKRRTEVTATAVVVPLPGGLRRKSIINDGSAAVFWKYGEVSAGFAGTAEQLRDLADGELSPGDSVCLDAPANQIVVVCPTDLTSTLLNSGGQVAPFDLWGHYAADSLVVVKRGATDAINGANLIAAVAAAKLLTPGGNAISPTNQVHVILPPGGFALNPVSAPAAALDLDTDNLSLIGMGAFRSYETGPAPASCIYSAGGAGKGPTLSISATLVGLVGLRVRNTGGQDGNHGLLVKGSVSDFIVERCEFGATSSSAARAPVYADGDLNGYWKDCFAGAWGWTPAAGHGLLAIMRDCIGGNNSFACNGQIGASAALYRCKGGTDCFAGYSGSGTAYGSVLAGALLEDCVASGRSFGGGNANSSCAGTLVRCRNLTLTDVAMYAGSGLSLRDCEFKQTTAAQHCIYVPAGLGMAPRVLKCILDAPGAGYGIKGPGGAPGPTVYTAQCVLGGINPGYDGVAINTDSPSDAFDGHGLL